MEVFSNHFKPFQTLNEHRLPPAIYSFYYQNGIDSYSMFAAAGVIGSNSRIFFWSKSSAQIRS